MTSSKEFEAQVETRRASVESTLDALKEKMSLGQVVDEVGAYVGGADVKDAFRNMGRQVRDNPVAFGLVGVGLAWLMLGGAARRPDQASGEDWDDRRHRDDAGSGQAYGRAYSDAGGSDYGRAAPGGNGERYGSAFGSPYAGGGDDPQTRPEGMASRAAHAVSGAVADVGERLSSAGERVTEAVSGVGGRMRAAGDAGRERLRHMGDEVGSHLPNRRDMSRRGARMSDSLTEAMEAQPLVLGALAVAMGAAIGAALPATQAEDRWLGAERDGMIDRAKATVGDMRHQAVDAAKAGLRAASDAAEAEGLTPEPGGKTLAAKVETVVRAGMDEARQAIDPDLARGAEDSGASQRPV